MGPQRDIPGPQPAQKLRGSEVGCLHSSLALSLNRCVMWGKELHCVCLHLGNRAALVLTTEGSGDVVWAELHNRPQPLSPAFLIITVVNTGLSGQPWPAGSGAGWPWPGHGGAQLRPLLGSGEPGAVSVLVTEV